MINHSQYGDAADQPGSQLQINLPDGKGARFMHFVCVPAAMW